MKSSRGASPCLEIIGEALPRSILLFTTAIAIQIVIGIWLGLKKAQRPGGILDRATSVATMIVYGLPGLVAGHAAAS
ncbi:MAG: hypothetical protein M0C28_24400 [Candidatus Moduliflexus flocculans]|nr:hypothetical protein [Candidatus Moduliflexus flocculans]